MSADVYVPCGTGVGVKRWHWRQVGIYFRWLARAHVNGFERCENAAGKRRASFRREAIDCHQDRILIVGRGLNRKSVIAERDDADSDGGWLVIYETFRGGFSGFHTSWFDIVCGHTARNVERQNDRAFDVRQTDFGLRAGQCHAENREREQKKNWRDVAARAGIAL